MSIRSRLLTAIVSLSIVIAALIGMGIYSTEVMVAKIDNLVDDHVAAQRELKLVSDAYAVSIVDTAHKVRSGQLSWEAGSKSVADAVDTLTSAWTAFADGGLAPEETELAQGVEVGMSSAEPAMTELSSILTRKDALALVEFIDHRLYQAMDPITAAVSSLIDLQDDGAEDDRQNARSLEHTLFWLQMALAAAAVAALIVSGYAIVRSVAGRLSVMQTALESMAKGDLDKKVPFVDRMDEIGKIAKAAEVFRENGLKVRELTEAEKATQLANLDSRRAMMRELRRAFGTVVDASVGGDFSSRVAATFDDEELNSLAGSVNTLVETVERGLNETEQVLSALARTDLTPRMNGDYRGAFARLRDDVNAVAENLTDVVGKLRSTSGGLKMATGEILAGANDLSERTTKQAATIEETSAAMEQLSTTVTSSAKNAETASHKALVASQAAEAGGAVMRDATAAMERISSSSAKISSIIGMIDDIAFQTNLLALNASVEAARAGEAGKGFAVVAVEVRRLAQSAANASSEVKALIDQSSQEVVNGSRLVDDAARKLTEMLGLVRESAGAMQSIARTSGEQASAIAEINTAVRQMDEMTQHNAALVEETNAAIEQTEAQAGELDRIVSQFRVSDTATPVPVTPLRPKASIQSPAPARRYLVDGNAAISADWSEF